MGVKFEISSVFKGIDKTSKIIQKIQKVGKIASTKMSGMWEKATGKTAGAFSWLKSKVSGAFSGINSTFQKSGSSLKKFLAIAGTFAGFAAFTAAGKAAINTGAEFGQTLAAASAKFGIFDKSSQDFKNIEKVARDVGATTEFTATEAAKGLDFLAMAGFNANQSIASLPLVVNLATAAGVDLATATDIASDSLGSLGKMSSDTGVLMKNLSDINDLYAKTTTTSNTTMQLMFETFKEAAPIATTAGAKMQELATLTGLLANAGIKGSVAGTTLKNMYVSLANAKSKALAILQKYNIKTKDSTGNFLSMTDILKQMEKGFIKMGTAEKTAALAEIFGRIPLAGVNVLLKEGAKGIDSYREKIDGMQGSSTKMANFMRDTTMGNFKTLGSVIESSGISLFKQLEPTINNVTTGLISFVATVDKFISNGQGLSDTLTLLLKIFAPALMALTFLKIVMGVKSLIIMVKSLIATAKLLNVVLAANPFIAIAMLLIFLVGIIIANWDFFGPYFEKLWLGMKNVAGIVADWIVEKFKLVKDAVMLYVSVIKLFYLQVFKWGSDLVAGILKGFLKLMSYIPGLGDKAAAALKKINDMQGKISDSRNEALMDVQEGVFNVKERVQGRDPDKLYTPARTQKEIYQSTEKEQVEISINDNTGKATIQGGEKSKRANFNFKRNATPAFNN